MEENSNISEKNKQKDIKKMASKQMINIIEATEYKNSISGSNDMINFFMMLIVIGFLVQYLFNTPSNDGYSGQATAEIWSYGIMLLSLVCILIFTSIIPNDNAATVGAATLIPVLLILIAFFWAISLRLKYFKQINKNEVPSYFYGWSMISNFLLTTESLIIVLIIKSIFNNLLSKSEINNQINNVVNLSGGQESMKIALGNFILVFIIYVVIGIQQVILDNFTVNG